MLLGSFNSSLINCSVTDNLAPFGGGIVFGNSNPVLVGVIINDNTTFMNGGIVFYGSNPILEYVTMVNNSSDDGGGIWCYDSNPVFENCILWNNTPLEVFFYESEYTSTITISCSDIQGGEAGIETNDNGTVYWLENNIDADPLFCDPDNGDYRLQTNSPCFTDECGYMGYTDETCEAQLIDEILLQPTAITLSQNYPNPFNPSTTIEYGLSAAGDVKLSIYNIRGQLVDVIQSGFQPAGYHSVEWAPGELPSGIYLVEMRAGEFRKTVKVTFVK